ncbi:hypothetical protein DFH94DRAFT_844205 [Russula ochroleuca]|uniref:Uncharacterized protein n=1 Tax=Russula ochroleuca TaxID=152965 RepID=A0A9P5TA73_9AGAM|nr:hypothetical protein DFH94DRAFT_844205 [Russula ochroleuca]
MAWRLTGKAQGWSWAAVVKDVPQGEMVIVLRGSAICVGRDRASVVTQPPQKLGLMRGMCQGRHSAEGWRSSHALQSGSIGRTLFKCTGKVTSEGTFALEKGGTVGSNSTMGEGMSSEEYDLLYNIGVDDQTPSASSIGDCETLSQAADESRRLASLCIDASDVNSASSDTNTLVSDRDEADSVGASTDVSVEDDETKIELLGMGVLWHIGCDKGVPNVRTTGGRPDGEEEDERLLARICESGQWGHRTGGAFDEAALLAEVETGWVGMAGDPLRSAVMVSENVIATDNHLYEISR